MTKSYFVRFNNKDYRENPNLLTELLELEHKFQEVIEDYDEKVKYCLLYTSPSPRDRTRSRMPSSA